MKFTGFIFSVLSVTSGDYVYRWYAALAITHGLITAGGVFMAGWSLPS